MELIIIDSNDSHPFTDSERERERERLCVRAWSYFCVKVLLPLWPKVI
jgi:hypothetical protein